MPESVPLSSEELLKKCISICEDRKASDIVAYDVQSSSVLADFYLLVNGNSSTHIRAIAAHLEKGLKDEGLLPRTVDGVPSSNWMVMDYGDLLIHIFHPDARAYYCIDALYKESCQIYPG